ncbi:MAG: integrase domain-containing protein [Rhodanobacteraceae bacterium]
MSKRSKTINAAKQVAIKAGGSNLTRQARVRTAKQFVECMYDHNFQIPDLRSVGAKHIRLFVDARRDAGDVDRTLQNLMSHIRVMLRTIDRQGMAGDPLISNKALGIDHARRNGKNKRVSPQADQLILAAAMECDDYVDAAVQLQRQLGIRAQEAVRSGPSLRMWEQQLVRGESVHVIAGTKTGKPRFTHPVDRVAALVAVRFGLGVLSKNQLPDLFPQATLEQAVKRYQNVWHNHLGPASLEGFTSHSYRYAYTQDRMLQCIEAGMSKRDVLATVALDLGHGDGRGRYVRFVYAQPVELLKKLDGCDSRASRMEVGNATDSVPSSLDTVCLSREVTHQISGWMGYTPAHHVRRQVLTKWPTCAYEVAFSPMSTSSHSAAKS